MTLRRRFIKCSRCSRGLHYANHFCPQPRHAFRLHCVCLRKIISVTDFLLMAAVEIGACQKISHIICPSNRFLDIGSVCRGVAEAEAEMGATGSPRVFSARQHGCTQSHTFVLVSRTEHYGVYAAYSNVQDADASWQQPYATPHSHSGPDEVQNPTFMRQSG